MAVYLLHFDPPYRHAAHYLGWTSDDRVEQRLEEHRTGRGARLCAVAVQAGARLILARVWPGQNRSFERKLKRRKESCRLCPICRLKRGGRR